MEFELMGTKAKVNAISARTRDNIWSKDDYFIISISLDSAIDGLLGFAVELPKGAYDSMRFPPVQLKQWIKQEAEKKLAEILKYEEQKKKEANHCRELDKQAQMMELMLDVKR